MLKLVRPNVKIPACRVSSGMRVTKAVRVRMRMVTIAVVAEFDPSSPSIARMYTGGLGGKDTYAADRDAGLKLVEIFPGIVDVLKANKLFLVRAVRWAGEQGLDQFIDLGAGLPAEPNTHQTVRTVVPGACVAYIDNDPVAVSHLRGEIGSGVDGLTVIDGDVRDASRILAEVAGGIDLSRPACLIMGALLHFFDEAAARDLVAAYAAAAPAGSCLIVSALSGAGEIADKFTAAYTDLVAPIYCHSLEVLTGFLAPMELVPPGITDTAAWRSGEAEATAAIPQPIRGLGVIARL